MKRLNNTGLISLKFGTDIHEMNANGFGFTFVVLSEIVQWIFLKNQYRRSCPPQDEL